MVVQLLIDKEAAFGDVIDDKIDLSSKRRHDQVQQQNFDFFLNLWIPEPLVEKNRERCGEEKQRKKNTSNGASQRD